MEAKPPAPNSLLDLLFGLSICAFAIVLSIFVVERFRSKHAILAPEHAPSPPTSDDKASDDE